MNVCVRLVDDDDEVRKSLRDYLSMLDWEVREFCSGEEFLDFGDLTSPGCIVLDLTMPKLNGIEVFQKLRQKGCNLPVIFLSGTGTIPDAVKAMGMGAETFLEKPAKPEIIRELIVKAVAKQAGHNIADAEAIEQKKRLLSLTEREKDVALLVAQGLLNKTIAERLNISVTTVKTHRANVFAKLGIKKAVELARIMLNQERENR